MNAATISWRAGVVRIRPGDGPMKVLLHGVRGSACAPGIDFVRVGGHTSCVAVTPSGQAVPTLLLDGGSGLMTVTTALSGSPFRGDILLTHLHWDHVHGLPFFAAGDADAAHVRVLLPAQYGAEPGHPGSAAALLAGSMSPPHFPISPDGLRGQWVFEAMDPGRFRAGGCQITALEVPHKGGRTFGYRIEADGASIAYLPDHDPAVSAGAGLGLARGVDVLLHGGMFARSELATARRFGHATVDEAAAFGAAAGAGRVVIIHHGPQRTDDEVETLVRDVSAESGSVRVGHEGDMVLG